MPDQTQIHHRPPDSGEASAIQGVAVQLVTTVDRVQNEPLRLVCLMKRIESRLNKLSVPPPTEQIKTLTTKAKTLGHAIQRRLEQLHQTEETIDKRLEQLARLESCIKDLTGRFTTQIATTRKLARQPASSKKQADQTIHKASCSSQERMIWI